MKTGLFCFLMLVLLAGCGREKTRTYQAPKEQSAVPPMQVPAHQAPVVAVPPVATGFDAELPKDWTEKPGSGMRMASYTIAGTSIDFYLISLTMGDVPSNVNRWRGQVGLAPATPEDIAKEIVNFQMDGHAVNYIEIYNDKGGKGIIAAIVDLSPQFWYFTAKGSVDELKAHAGDIRKFFDSVKIN